jgi:putative hydrolase of the HAD superfamily
MTVRAVFVDAAGTLLKPREPVGVTYARAARAHGHDADPADVEGRFRRAFRARRGTPQSGDGRAFWAGIVRDSVGTDDPALFEVLYAHYATPRAWWIDSDALHALTTLARRGIRLGIVSNWDVRLRLLYHRMALERLFSVLACSAELGVEKPDAWIFLHACRLAGVSPGEAVHLGDDPDADVDGATAAGLTGLLHDEDEDWRTLPARIDRLARPFLGFRAGVA